MWHIFHFLGESQLFKVKYRFVSILHFHQSVQKQFGKSKQSLSVCLIWHAQLTLAITKIIKPGGNESKNIYKCTYYFIHICVLLLSQGQSRVLFNFSSLRGTENKRPSEQPVVEDSLQAETWITIITHSSQVQMVPISWQIKKPSDEKCCWAKHAYLISHSNQHFSYPLTHIHRLYL